jgi:hypothetical protein
MRSGIARLCVAALALLTIACLAGCAQNTEATSPQRSAQDQITPTSTGQELLTAGSDVKVYIINAPGASGLPDDIDGDGQEDGETAPWVTAPGTTVGKTNAGYAQSGIVLNITTGGTAPSATGTTTGTANAAQTPSQHQTVSPVQDIKPEVTAAAPITVGLPGSATSGTANVAGSGGQMGSPVSSPVQTPTYADFRVPIQYADQALKVLQDMIARATAGATTQPQ